MPGGSLCCGGGSDGEEQRETLALATARLHTHSLIVVGGGGVGKSALALRFMFNDFTDDYDPTKADSYRRTYRTLDGRDCTIDILDTAGQEEYAAIRDNYFRSGDAFVAVFALNERAGFEMLPALHDQICRAVEIEPPFVLVGNKTDLIEDNEEARKVGKEEAEQLSATWGDCVYLEASAKKDENVETVFSTVIERVVEIKKKRAAEAAAKRLSRPEEKSGCTLQ